MYAIRSYYVLGWAMPGGDTFSITRAFLGHLFKGKRFAFNTSSNGSDRAMVPIGNYEKVMPLDILPTLLVITSYSIHYTKLYEGRCPAA